MVNFDRQLFAFMKSIGGYYRRYSDDIIISCDAGKSEDVMSMLKRLISEVELEIAEEKTNFFSVKNEVGKIIITDKKTLNTSAIEYLGLSFDGSVIRLKNKSISKYYHKMKRTINTKTHFAINKTDKSGGVLFAQQLLRKFTPIGSKHHPILRRSKTDKSVFNNTGLKSFGNFWTYVEKASKICHSPEIKHQLNNNRRILQKRIKLARLIIEKVRANKRRDEFHKCSRIYH